MSTMSQAQQISPTLTHSGSFESKFHNYEVVSHNDKEFKIKFDVSDIPVALANALRRSFSSLCPTVTFNDSYESKSVVVHTNTSSLHNEFISHRLSLIPINMDDNQNLAFETSFNDLTGKREFRFSDETLVPVFSLNVKNDSTNIERRDTVGIIDVTSNDFQILLGEEPLENSVFFPVDVFTGEKILINKLKSNISDESEGEEMVIDCFPRLGLGKENSRHDPTGTVTYEFRTDNEERVNQVFSEKISVLQKERTEKGLNVLSEEEVNKLRSSFNLLDKQRVYTRNSNGDPDYFMFSVESIGFLHPAQIVVDSVFNLSLTLNDVINSIKIDNTEKGIELTTNSKILIENYSAKTADGVVIKIKDENHTIGNLVQYYLRRDFLADRNNSHKQLSIASYRMPHPTIEEIEFILVPSDNLNIEDMITHLITKYSGVEKMVEDKNNLQERTKLTILHTYLVSLFISSVQNTNEELMEFYEHFKTVSGKTDTTYSVV